MRSPHSRTSPCHLDLQGQLRNAAKASGASWGGLWGWRPGGRWDLAYRWGVSFLPFLKAPQARSRLNGVGRLMSHPGLGSSGGDELSPAFALQLPEWHKTLPESTGTLTRTTLPPARPGCRRRSLHIRIFSFRAKQWSGWFPEQASAFAKG